MSPKNNLLNEGQVFGVWSGCGCPIEKHSARSVSKCPGSMTDAERSRALEVVEDVRRPPWDRGGYRRLKR